MGATGARAIVLDAGALIAFERGVVRMRVLVETAFRQGRRLSRDVVDGHAALLTARLSGVVVTSDPADLTRFGTSIAIETI